ncbi:MAG: Rrf2 family transcriptional regulator [Gemmatimonadales bacterium]|nr:Rrf2 family transcriptional regulator [Gemmatimonadales bacterium]
MLLSRTAEYAVQALIYLATRPDDGLTGAREVASYLGTPAPYLSNILKKLVQHRLLVSTRGRGGGFRVVATARRLSVLHIVELIDGPHAFEGCVLGLKRCADATACPVHHVWKPLKDRMLRTLAGQTIGGMADLVRAGRYRLV